MSAPTTIPSKLPACPPYGSLHRSSTHTRLINRSAVHRSIKINNEDDLAVPPHSSSSFSRPQLPYGEHVRSSLDQPSYNTSSHENIIISNRHRLNNLFANAPETTQEHVYQRVSLPRTRDETLSILFQSSLSPQNQNNNNNNTHYSNSYDAHTVTTTTPITLSRNSLYPLLSTVYPEYEWQSWRLDPFPWGYSVSLDVIKQRNYFNWLSLKNGMRTLEDWYCTTAKAIFGGERRTILSQQYNHSLIQALSTVYPEYQWKPWRFLSSAKGCWDDIVNQRQYFDSLTDQLEVEYFTDWEGVKVSDIDELGGNSVLVSRYNRSLAEALETIYPEYPWQFRRRMYTGYWDNEENVREYLLRLQKQYHLRRAEDWLEMSTQHDINHWLVSKYGGLVKLLAKFLPELQFSWQMKGTSPYSVKHGVSKFHRRLYHAVCELFPESEVIVNYLHPLLRYSSDSESKNIQLDIYLPQLNLAFEAHGEQHFRFHFGTDPIIVQTNDAIRREKCQEIGISIIEIPFWWNRDLRRLVAIIRENRPDLLVDWSIQ